MTAVEVVNHVTDGSPQARRAAAIEHRTRQLAVIERQYNRTVERYGPDSEQAAAVAGDVETQRAKVAAVTEGN